MRYQIELTGSNPIATAVIRATVPAQAMAQFVPASCGEVWRFVRSTGLRGAGRHLALYREDGLVEVGAEVAEQFTGNERIHCSQLPGGVVATTVHFGPYGLLKNAHAAIREWCALQGHLLSGTSWEIYGHWEESWNRDPSKIRTDVFHLLQMRSK